MNNWRERFLATGRQIQSPDSTDIDDRIDYIHTLIRPIALAWRGPVSDREYITIVKIPASEYQQAHFNELFTFAFQDLVTGQKGPFIKKANRGTFGIKDEYSQSGGPYPLWLEMDSLSNRVEAHYIAQLHILIQERNNLLLDYQKRVESELGESWWDVYREYMKSPAWYAKRELRLLYDEGRCQMDGEILNLVVHHLNYNNIGDENMHDLMTVCRSCHQKLHPYKTL